MFGGGEVSGKSSSLREDLKFSMGGNLASESASEPSSFGAEIHSSDDLARLIVAKCDNFLTKQPVLNDRFFVNRSTRPTRDRW